MSKETAFHGKLAAMTDQWMDLFGYFAPLVVTDTLEEYRACRETAALMDFTMLRKVTLDGPGALDSREPHRHPGRLEARARTDRLRRALRRAREDGRRLHDDDALAGQRPLLRSERPRLRDLHRRCRRHADRRARGHRRDPAPLPAGAEEPRDPPGPDVERPVERRLSLLHVPRGRRDRGHPGLHDAARVHRGARVRALGRARPLPRALGRAARGGDAGRHGGHRDGRARPVPNRRRLHHRRYRVRPLGVALRVRPRLVGRPRQG